jgi:predicted phage-related endonuclease
MLTDAQIAARKGRLTASRIACLMTSDARAIHQLYLEMTDQAEPEDLSRVWPVRLGEATEQLNLDWYEMKGNPVSRRGEFATHPDHPWAGCTLDGWDDALLCPIECKHIGGREPLEVVIERYQPQMQWQMECTGAAQCAISVIIGASAPVVEYIDRDLEYAREMLTRGQQFMACVRDRRLPVALEPVAAPVDAARTYDMEGNNTWADQAAEWLATRPFADRCEQASKLLKAIVPADAKRCHGHGIYISRDRAGRLSLRESKT